MDPSSHLVMFTLDEQRFAIPVLLVDRVIRAVEVVPLPGASPLIVGIINVQGQLIPVINVRRRVHAPEREVKVDDQFIISRASGRTVALHVDSTQVIVNNPAECTRADQLVATNESVEQVMKTDDGLILVENVDAFLTAEDQRILGTALDAKKGSN